MDTIDVTSSGFSLENLDQTAPTFLGYECSESFVMMIYIGIAFLIVAISSAFLYKFYGQKHVTFQDNLDECYGDKCER